jgi:hypothetical protein
MSTDFPGGLYSYQLRLEIEHSSITTAVAYILTNDDTVSIVFTDELSTDELAALNTLIADHVPLQNKEVMLDYYPAVISTSSTDFMKLGRFQHAGLINVGAINGIDLVSNMDEGATSFTVRIICRDDNRIVCEKTFTNTTAAINTFSADDIVYQPLKPSLFEVLCKVSNSSSSKKYAYIEEIKVWQ